MPIPPVQILAPWLRPLRGGAPLAMVLLATVAAGCALGDDSGGSPTRNPASAPPQFLPVTARWCLETAPADGPEAPPICIGLEVARTRRQQAWGMQMRPPLPPRQGMWFPFDSPKPARFWMHRTPEPLDMIFVRDGKVVLVEPGAEPCMRLPCPSYGPAEPVDGVVELGAGQAAALGIGWGSSVRIEASPPEPPSAPAPD